MTGAEPAKRTFLLQEVSGLDHAAALHAINGQFPDAFHPLSKKHLETGFWWLVHCGVSLRVVAFAGMVPWEPFPRVGYLKRTAVLPEARGHGLQGRLIAACEERARSGTDWTHMVSETEAVNVHSANNFIRAGYLIAPTERPWDKEMIIWRKVL